MFVNLAHSSVFLDICGSFSSSRMKLLVVCNTNCVVDCSTEISADLQQTSNDTSGLVFMGKKITHKNLEHLA